MNRSASHGKVGLAISGGGFRASLFHLGSLWRLNELGWLSKLHTLTSVSGGSITAACLAKGWHALEFDETGRARNFEAIVAGPVCDFCTRRIDTPAFLKGTFWPFRPTGNFLAGAYRRYLFGDLRLTDLPASPDAPRFLFLATSLQSGKSVRFSREELYDYTIGKLPDPDVGLATAVAASSAFPPLLSPLVLRTDPSQWQDTEYEVAGVDRDAYRIELRLMDGGVYDNLGLEPIWKADSDELEGHFDTVLASDAGAPLRPEPAPSLHRIRIAVRMQDIMTDQPRALRKRELIERYQADPPPYRGSYWGISTRIDNYRLDTAMLVDNELTASLQHLHTRLTSMPRAVQAHLINWGYALTDAAMRRHVLTDDDPAPAPRWPRPDYPLDAVAGGPMKKIPKKKLIPAVIAALILAVPALGLGFVWYKTSRPDIPDYRPVEKLVRLDQNWTAAQRDFYYRTPQGTEFFGLRYDWVAALERPFGKTPLVTREFMSRLGFIFDDKPAAGEPDMPIGFTWHENAGERMFDLTCAGCHTGQLRYKNQAIRIDGGPGMHSFPSMKPDQFLATMTASLFNTWAWQFKFNRFAKKVLGDAYPKGKSELRRNLRRTWWAIFGYAIDNRGLYPTEEGFGRTDALGRIGNTVFGDEIDHANYRVANAPVNYPHLWDIWLFDWVQWTGSVQQPMARNVNEALGTRARLDLFDANGKLLSESERFNSTVRVEDLHCLEVNLQYLGPPRWPDDIFGAPDPVKVEAGRRLFAANCAACHGPHRTKTKDCTVCHGPNSPVLDDKPHAQFDALWPLAMQGLGDEPPASADTAGAQLEGYWKILHIHSDYIGTDHTSVGNLRANRFDVSAIEPPRDRQGFEDPTRVEWATGLQYIGEQAKHKQYAKLGIPESEWDDYNGYLPDEPKARDAYRPRPLEGIWATPPFLHNGSVPTIHDLLLPEEDRPSVFYLGRVDYDPRRLGLVTRPFDGGFEFDTRETGNSAAGHAFDDGLCGNGVIGIRVPDMPGYCRSLAPAEIEALLEYLKVHSDATPERPRPAPSDPHCQDRWAEGGAG